MKVKIFFAIGILSVLFVGGCASKTPSPDKFYESVQKRTIRRNIELSQISGDNARSLCTVGVLESCKKLLTQFFLSKEDYKNGNYLTKGIICKNSKTISCSEEKSKTKTVPFQESCKINEKENQLECERADKDNFYVWKAKPIVDLQNTAAVVQAYVNQDKRLYDCRNEYYLKVDKKFEPGVDGRVTMKVNYDTKTHQATKKLMEDTVGDDEFHRCVETALDSIKLNDLDLKKKAEVNIIFAVKKFKDQADL